MGLRRPNIEQQTFGITITSYRLENLKLATEKPVSIGHDLTSGLVTKPKTKVDSMETLLFVLISLMAFFVVFWFSLFGLVIEE